MPACYTVAVRSLCEFTAKQGDIDIRFTPAPSGQQGMAAHLLLAAERGANYLKELVLEGESGELRVRGRADGYDAEANRLDEFKTYRGDLQSMRGNHRALHWAQLKVYGALLCRQRALRAINLALVYFNIKTEQQDILEERHSAADLDAYFEAQCTRFLEWARHEIVHRLQRDAWLSRATFPQEQMRPGQRELAMAVYRAALRGRTLMAQAPTGIGKTLGTIFPMLKAAPKAKLDKIFYLVAKTTGRRAALEALHAVRPAGTAKRLRVLEYVARETACEYPGRACSGDECPLAAGFYDRLADARRALLEEPQWEREALRRVALDHAVCPYFLAQEMLRWSDVIVCDYNYYFDGSAVLHALTVQNGWRIGVLVDEAHNLLPRARSMYSAVLSPQSLAAALPGATPAIGRALKHVLYHWNMLDTQADEDYRVHAKVPEALAGALQTFLSAANDQLDASAVLAPALLGFYFEALHFARLQESFAPHSMFDSSRSGHSTATVPATTLCVRNIVPGPHLAPRFAAASSCVCFSATLAPREFHRRLLGLPEDTAWIDVASPFSAGQLVVHVQSHICTRFHRRRASLAPIADLIERQHAAQPSTYLAFFSSFEYLEAALHAMRSRHPQVPVWRQARQMSLADREQFLGRFIPGACGVGFAVLGGSFGEGIDLAGSGLAGVFIATLGLPQVNGINAEFERRMQQLFGAGFEFTYLYPGLQKVVQAAGRVIRGPADRGTLHLIDERFSRAHVQQLLPAWWEIRSS